MKKTHCLRGHDIAVVGRAKSGMCMACRRERMARDNERARRKRGAVPRESAEYRAKVSRFGESHHRWRGQKASRQAIHKKLIRDHPKTGVCEECGGTEPRTEYAFKRHPEPHTRDRGDYRELCARCHRAYDAWLGLRFPGGELRAA